MAELMKHGKQETRTWSTNYRGLVLICASFAPFADRELIELCGPEQYARILQLLGPKWFNVVKRGSAIAVGRLVKCEPYTIHAAAIGWKRAEEITFVKHFAPGLQIHFYEDVTPIEPFPWKGIQGWKTLTQEEKAKIKIIS